LWIGSTSKRINLLIHNKGAMVAQLVECVGWIIVDWKYL